MKKIFTVFLVLLLMSFSIAVSANPNSNVAYENMSDQAINQLLAVQGVPQEVIDFLPRVQKIEILEEGLVFVSFTEEEEAKYDKNTNEGFSTLSWSNNTIPNMKHMIAVWEVAGVQFSTQKSFVLTYNWEWNYSPLQTLTDTIAVQWERFQGVNNDKLEFNHVTNGAGLWYQASRSDGSIPTHTFSKSTYTPLLHDSYTGTSMTFDIKAGHIVTSYGSQILVRYDKHQGYIRQQIKSTTAHNGTGNWVSTNVWGRYFHKIITASNPSVSVGKEGPSISLAAQVAHDDGINLGSSYIWYHRTYSSSGGGGGGIPMPY